MTASFLLFPDRQKTVLPSRILPVAGASAPLGLTRALKQP